MVAEPKLPYCESVTTEIQGWQIGIYEHHNLLRNNVIIRNILWQQFLEMMELLESGMSLPKLFLFTFYIYYANKDS